MDAGEEPVDLEPITIDVKEAIRLSSLGRTFIYQKMSEGSFKSVKAKNRRLIIFESFKKWLISLPTEAEETAPTSDTKKK
jgi:hypothetical protein